MVRGGKSPVEDLKIAQEMGYAISIVPGLLLQHILGSCEEILEELKETNKHPVHCRDISVRELFRRAGSDAWDDVRTRFGD